MVKQLQIKLMLLLCALVAGSSSAWAATAKKSGSWDLTSTSSNWTSSNCETYFSQPYGMKKKDAYIMNKGISDFSTENITSIKIGVKCLQNGGTTSRLTVYLVNSSGSTVGSGQVFTPTNASSASSTAYSYVTFNSGFTGVTGFKVQCTTFGKNILINGASYEVSYTTPDVAATGVSLPETAEVAINKTITLTPTFTPVGATNRNVTWSSDNTSVATVDEDGIVTGKALGSTYINVTTEDGGFTDRCMVTVNDGAINLATTGTITFNTFNGTVLGTGGYKTQDCELTASNGNTYTWKETNGYYNNSGWQVKDGGNVKSPTIKSANGFTITVTYSNGNPVKISDGTNEATGSLTTTKTSTTVTLKGNGGYTVISGITITPTPSNPSNPVDNGDGTITITTTDNMDGWRAFYDASQDYTLDANTKAYVVAAKSGTEGEVELTKLNVTAIPHGEAVILKTTDAGHSMTLTKTTGVATLGTNLLAVTNGSSNVDGYRLGYGNIGGSNSVGFFKYTTTTAPAAGIVYIDKSNVNISAGARGLFISFQDETTGIGSVNSEEIKDNGYYDLSGRRVSQPTKGLYIVNGKKVIIK